MSRMIRSIRSSLGTAVVLCAFAESCRAIHGGLRYQRTLCRTTRRRHHEHDLYPDRCPGRYGYPGTWINNRGQIVGGYVDDVRRHGLLLSDGEFRTLTAPPGAFLIACVRHR